MIREEGPRLLLPYAVRAPYPKGKTEPLYIYIYKTSTAGDRAAPRLPMTIGPALHPAVSCEPHRTSGHIYLFIIGSLSCPFVCQEPFSQEGNQAQQNTPHELRTLKFTTKQSLIAQIKGKLRKT